MANEDPHSTSDKADIVRSTVVREAAPKPDGPMEDVADEEVGLPANKKSLFNHIADFFSFKKDPETTQVMQTEEVDILLDSDSIVSPVKSFGTSTSAYDESDMIRTLTSRPLRSSPPRMPHQARTQLTLC